MFRAAGRAPAFAQVGPCATPVADIASNAMEGATTRGVKRTCKRVDRIMRSTAAVALGTTRELPRRTVGRVPGRGGEGASGLGGQPPGGVHTEFRGHPRSSVATSHARTAGAIVATPTTTPRRWQPDRCARTRGRHLRGLRRRRRSSRPRLPAPGGPLARSREPSVGGSQPLHRRRRNGRRPVRAARSILASVSASSPTRVNTSLSVSPPASSAHDSTIKAG